uniref:Uncharacterized protein n=1 Tax=Rhizophora mucronata TaxID=61149 RepID=A0A2P2JJD2_RHIMU
MIIIFNVLERHLRSIVLVDGYKHARVEFTSFVLHLKVWYHLYRFSTGRLHLVILVVLLPFIFR